MELLCIETQFEPKASFDSSIVDDDRILRNLMITEERYLITGSYFKCLQTDLKPHMRDVVANWMLEVLLALIATYHMPSCIHRLSDLAWPFTVCLACSHSMQILCLPNARVWSSRDLSGNGHNVNTNI